MHQNLLAVSLGLALGLLCPGYVWAQINDPITITSSQIYPTLHSSDYEDPTVRGTVSLKNSGSRELKDVTVQAEFYHRSGQLLFTEEQKVHLKARSETEVLFSWPNPAISRVDRVEVTVFGKEGGGVNTLKQTVMYPRSR